MMSKRELPVKKNEEILLKIHDLGTEGQGIGRYEGYTLFVDGALPGEEVRVRVIKAGKKFGVGRLMEVIAASDDRMTPVCPIAKQCGGCTLQHFSYDGQLSYKRNNVQQLMNRVGKVEDVAVQPTMGMADPWHYRNKVQFPVREINGDIRIGYYAKRSHRVVETEICYIQDRRNEEIRQILLDWMKAYHVPAYNEEKHSGLIRHLVTRYAHSTGDMQVTIVINGRKLRHVDELVSNLKNCGYISAIALNINMDKTNVIMGKEMKPLFGPDYIEDTIGDVKFMISPLSFYQVNPQQTEKLYAKALEYADLKGHETVLDLYCGIGSISLFLAQKAKKVIGVEIVPEAIENAERNARMNGLTNTEFYVGKAEEVIPRLYKEEGITADVVVVDPPRKGCDEALLETIVNIAPEKLVYVSCDPGTLARDIRYLSEHGFKVDKVQPVDMFPHSTHVETVLVLNRAL